MPSTWRSLTKINQRAFSSIDEPLNFLLRDCRECKVSYILIKKPKKGGGTRILYAPSRELNFLQKEINRIIQFWHVDMNQFGFMPRRSCKDNALHHVHDTGGLFELNRPPKWMVRMDLENAFPSVKEKDIETLFRDMFLPLRTNDFFRAGRDRTLEIYKELVFQFTRLTTYRGILPQGAPASPYLLNLVLHHKGIIQRLKAKCKEREKKREDCSITPFTLSVYADDFVFTSLRDRIPDRFIREATEIIEADGTFKINQAKTKRSSLKYKSHRITGLTFDNTRRNDSDRSYLAISRKTRKAYRRKIYRAMVILKKWQATEKRDGRV